MAKALKSSKKTKVSGTTAPRPTLRWMERISGLIYGVSQPAPGEGGDPRANSRQIKKQDKLQKTQTATFFLSPEAYQNDAKNFIKDLFVVGLFVFLLLLLLISLLSGHFLLALLAIFFESQLLDHMPWEHIFPGQNRTKISLLILHYFFAPPLLLSLAAVLAIIGQVNFILHQFRPGALYYLMAIICTFGYETKAAPMSVEPGPPAPIKGKEIKARTVQGEPRLNPFYIFVPILMFAWAFSYFIMDIYPYMGLVLWLLGVGLFMFGLWRAENIKYPQNLEPFTNNQKIGLAAILVTAFIVRVFKLQDIPHGLVHDECSRLLVSFSLPLPFSVNEWNYPNMPLLLNGLYRFLFSDNTIAFRMASVVPGTLTVYLVFQFTRFCFGNRAGLFAAFLSAFTFLPIAISRMTYDQVHIPFATVGVTYFFYKGLKLRRKLDFAWAACFLCFGLHSYAALRILPFIIAAFLIYLCFRDRKLLTENKWGFLVFAAVTLVLMGPLIYEMFGKGSDLWRRPVGLFIIRDTPLWQWPAFVTNAVIMILKDYFYSATIYLAYCIRWLGLPEKPVFDLITAACCIASLGIVFRRIKEPIYILILMTAFLSLLPQAGSMFHYPVARTLGLLPPVFMLAGLFLGRGYELTLKTSSRFMKIILQGLFAVILGYVFIANVRMYFVTNAEYVDYFPYESGLLGNEGIYECARQEMAFDKLGYAVTSELASHPTSIVVTAGRVENLQGYASYLDMPYTRVLKKGSPGVVYFFWPDKTNERLNLLKAFYPAGKYGNFQNPKTKDVLYWSYIVSQDELKANQGLNVQYYNNLDFAGKPVTQTAGEEVAYYWRENHQPVKAPFSARFSGGFYFSTDQTITYTLEAMDQTRFFIDDKLVLFIKSSNRITSVAKAIFLKAGPHRLRVETIERSGLGGLGLFWNGPYSGPKAIIPRESMLPTSTMERLFTLKKIKQ